MQILAQCGDGVGENWGKLALKRGLEDEVRSGCHSLRCRWSDSAQRSLELWREGGEGGTQPALQRVAHDPNPYQRQLKLADTMLGMQLRYELD